MPNDVAATPRYSCVRITVEIYVVYYYCYYYIRLTAFFQDNLGKLVSER